MCVYVYVCVCIYIYGFNRKQKIDSMGSTEYKNKININLAIGQSYKRQNGGAELVENHGFNK
jgi:hypothetical protein